MENLFDLWLTGVKIIIFIGVPMIIVTILVTYLMLFLVDMMWVTISGEQELMLIKFFVPRKVYEKLKMMLFREVGNSDSKMKG